MQETGNLHTSFLLLWQPAPERCIDISLVSSLSIIAITVQAAAAHQGGLEDMDYYIGDEV